MFLSNDNLSFLLDIKSQMKKWRLLSILLLALLLSIFLFNRAKKIESGSTTSLLNIKEACIGEIEISGIIFRDKYRLKVLNEIRDNDKIKALIINIDSPGGEIVGSEVLYEALKSISEKKPTVVLMGGLATSGGYMVSLASDYLIARNGTVTGSIGVLLQSFEATKLAENVGIKFETYKSSELKGSPSPFEKTTPLVDKMIRESIDDTYNFFIDLVAKRRGMDLEHMRQIGNGQIYTGRQALKLKLIDEIGGEKEVLQYLETRGINTKNLKIKEINLREPLSKFDMIEKFLGVFFKTPKNTLLGTYSLMLM
jgi:protease IV